MNMSTKSAATGILVLLSLVFFGTAVWLHVYHPADTVFNTSVWAIFSTVIGGTLVILNTDAKGDNKPANPPQEADNSVVPKE